MSDVIDELKLKLYEEQSQIISAQNRIIAGQNEQIDKLYRTVALMLTNAELEQLKLFEKLERTQNLKDALERAGE